jgi:hypothetical protein
VPERLRRNPVGVITGNADDGSAAPAPNAFTASREGRVATAYPLRFSLILGRIAGGILVVAVAIAVWDGMHGTAVPWRHWVLLAAIAAGVTLTLLPKSRWSLLLSCVSLALSLTAVSSVIGSILHNRP